MISAGVVANVVTSSVQAAVVVGIASVLPWLLRLDVPGVRYAFWRAVAVLCLALPWLQPLQRWQGTRPAAVAQVVETFATSAAGSTAQTTSHLTSAGLLVAVLAFGMLLRLCWLGLGLVRLVRLRRSAAAGPHVAIDTELQQTLGVHEEVRYAADLDHPVTFGLFKPVVLLPKALRAQSAEIQRAVIGHELIHVRRRDWGWLIAEELAVCLLWFHPAAWWLASRIQLTREEVVDELAVLLTGRRKTYIEALLAFSDSTSVVPTAAFARRRHLFRRIALVSREDVMSSRRIVASCAVMALVILGGSWYAVSAFPLRDRAADLSQLPTGPGALEKRAHQVTPENPIPRRIHFEAPVPPDTAKAAGGTIVVKLTLDEVGRVAEARAIEVAVKGAEFDVSLAGNDINSSLSRRIQGMAPEAAASIREAVRAYIDAALTSVRGWRYDPPAEAPLTFEVPVRIGAAPEIMSFSPAPRALRVGDNIGAPQKVRDVRPVYPQVARAANVKGTVVIEARIGVDGSVEEAHVLRSIPLLDQAALDAVKEWKFMPTLLNGQPVPVVMTVSVTFEEQ
jgi:TonB family protein